MKRAFPQNTLFFWLFWGEIKLASGWEDADVVNGACYCVTGQDVPLTEM